MQSQDAFLPSSAVTAERPGLLGRLLHSGRDAEKRSRSLTQNDGSYQHRQESAAAAAGRSLTPPASASSLFREKTNAATSAERKDEQATAGLTPRQRHRHWPYHLKWRHPQIWQQQQQQQQHPLQPQQQQQPPRQDFSSRPKTPGSHAAVPPPASWWRKPSPFSSAPCSVPVMDHSASERRLDPLMLPCSSLPGASGRAPRRVLQRHGVSAGQPEFMRSGHLAIAVDGTACLASQQQQLRQQSQPLFAAGQASRGSSAQENCPNTNGTGIPRQLLYSSAKAVRTGVSPVIRYVKPSSVISSHSSFGLCSPVAGCFPPPSLFAAPDASEAAGAHSAFPSAQVMVQAPPSSVTPANALSNGVRSASSVARAPGGPGNAVIDPKAMYTFNASWFFTQLYLLDSARRLELLAARISHSMRSRAFSHWILSHRYPIAKEIWNKKVLKEVEHLRRLRNNTERSRQNYAAETARKHSDAEAGTLDKSAELLILQEQQRESLAQQQAAADEQLQRVRRYKAKRAVVLGSLLLEHGLKRIVYNYQAFSIFALRSNLLTDHDILQHAIRMLPKFLPPAWKQLDPSRQAELLRSEYAHLVEPATIHLTSLREMYRLHRLDLEARSRRLGRYYRHFFAWWERRRAISYTEVISIW